MFIMLAKEGDPLDVANWRPIAILRAMHKLTSRMIYNRVSEQLCNAQPPDQCAFRPHYSIEDALFVAEMMLSRTHEFGLDIWAASLDMRKAFDRVEREPMLEAIAQQGVPEEYVELIRAFYIGERVQ
jgi:hypothetical protein